MNIAEMLVPDQDWTAHPLIRWTLTGLYVGVLALISMYGLHRYWLVLLFLRTRRKIARPQSRFAQPPAITVQLPMFNEAQVAERVIDAACVMDYPAERLQIQVIDDSTDASSAIARARVNHWSARGVDIQYLHRRDRTGYKAGALACAMPEVKGEFIAIFDADFIPPASFLRRTIHYFTDEKVGMVQARWGHLNRDYSMLTRVQSMMLDGHFVVEHIARNRSGRFFNFNGTAGIWRRAAIVDAGGWQHDTLTEDMDLSFRAQMRGWRFVYVPDALAPAEVPCEMNSFKSQQFRWAKGSAQTAKKLLPMVLRAKLPWHVKLEAVFHLTNNFAYLFLVILAMLQLPNMILRQQISRPELLLLDVPLFALTSGSIVLFYLTTHRALYGNMWEAVRRLPLMMALGIGLSLNNARAVVEGLIGHESEFVRTPKHGVTAKAQSWTKAKYRVSKNIYSWLEFGFGIYFVATIALATVIGAWFSIPFLVLFMIGFLYVGGLSLYQAR